MLGLGNNLNKAGVTGATNLGIVTDNLVMKHKYPVGAVQPLSDGAAYIDQGSGDKITTITPSSTFYVDFSICFWVYRQEAGTIDVMIDAVEGSNDGMVLFFQADNTLRLSLDANDVSTTTTFSTNQWYHIAVVQDDDGDTQQIYVDGALDKSGTAVSTLDNTNDTLSIARDVSSNNPFKGYLCNLGIWTKALEIADVKSIMWKQYTGLSSSETTLLTSWYPLETNANDSTGNYNGSTTGF